MRTRRVEIVRFLAALMIVLMAGCGKETVNIPDTTPPQVSSTTPVQAAAGVALNTVITATFTKPMNAATLTGTSFLVAGPGGAAVAGTVTYAATGSVATFTPTANLAYGAVYTATITTAATDQASPANSLAANYVWTFTTVAPPTPPTVTSATPAAGATNVPVNQALGATFSVAMNAATIDAATFTLTGAGGIAVAGTVAYTAAGATLTPTANLAYSTLYTATITTGATNSSGTPLASSYVWSFTTITPPPAVASTIPPNGATGVLPDQVLSATFNEAINCATLASPAATFTVAATGGAAVAGTVGCSGSVATFTPANALAVNTLYTAAITTAAKSPAGTALTSNYVWRFKTGTAVTAPTVISTVPANLATGVPTNQALSAVFNEGINASTINAATFKLAGPGNAAVTGAVTYLAAGSIATFTPAAALAPNAVYTATITTGAQDLQSRPLQGNYVWTFTTGALPDTTPPTVLSTIPANAATNVPTNESVSATFSKAMNAATINGGSYTLQGPGAAAVAGVVTYAAIGDTATFTPTANLAANTLFTATITTTVTDSAGNALAKNYVWTFTTGAAPDTTPPEIVITSPANAATNVAVNQTVNATFTKAMDPLTITPATFGLTGPGGVAVGGTVAYDPINFIATFTPTASLTGNSDYIATVTAGATDLAGNPLGTTGAPNPWHFSTGVVVLPPPVNLGTASLFGGFSGGAGMTNQGINTVVNGNIGTTGVSTLITGFHDSGPGCIYTETPLNVGLVNGNIDTAPPPPTVGCPTEGTAVTQAIATQAAADALSAYNQLVAFPNGLDVSTCPGCGGGLAGELGNRTLAPGIYKSAPGSYSISQGPLTLDAQGDANAFWVFQMATTLTVGTPSAHQSVLLVNGAQAKNVFWQVGTAATINGILGGGTMEGTIIAQAAISVSTAGVAAVTTLDGRALVLTGPVTVVNTVINVPGP
jgi:Ice-binding-like/Bacterial Ig-like domain